MLSQFKTILSLMVMVVLCSGFVVPAHALSIHFSTISITADGGSYALTVSGVNSAGTQILRDGYFLGDFLDAPTFPTEQTYTLNANKLADLQGLAAFFTGTFYTTAVRHSFSSTGSSYKTTFLIQREGSPLVDHTGSTNISFLLSNFKFETFTTSQQGTQVSGLKFSTVPEPATLLLLGSGLAGLAFFRRKFKV